MEFKIIKDFIDYEINQEGIVRNKHTKAVYYIYLYKGKYPMVKLTKDGTRHVLSVTTLIKNTFTNIHDLENEVWKPVTNFPNYSISNEGRIKNTKHNRLISQCFDKDGYCLASLSNNGESKLWRVHQLVAMTFIPNPENLPIPDHLDMNKSNNKVANLRWATYSQNAQNRPTLGIVAYKGVSLIRSNDMFLSNIKDDGRNIYLGTFKTAEEAACAYDTKAREIYGEHARLNFP